VRVLFLPSCHICICHGHGCFGTVTIAGPGQGPGKRVYLLQEEDPMVVVMQEPLVSVCHFTILQGCFLIIVLCMFRNKKEKNSQ
jgi:hypothetical protein